MRSSSASSARIVQKRWGPSRAPQLPFSARARPARDAPLCGTCWGTTPVAWGVRDGWHRAERWSHEPASVTIATLVAALILVAVSSAVARRLALPVPRLAEGYWPRWLTPVSRALVRQRTRRRDRDERSYQRLAAAADHEEPGACGWCSLTPPAPSCPPPGPVAVPAGSYLWMLSAKSEIAAGRALTAYFWLGKPADEGLLRPLGEEPASAPTARKGPARANRHWRRPQR